MTLLEAKDAARQESRAQKGKTYFVVVDAAGECDLSSKPRRDATVAAYKNGNEIALLPEHYNKVKEAPEPKASKTKTAKASADEPAVNNTTMAAKKANKPTKNGKQESKLTRGNNMALTKEQWAKVDARLKKEDISFSAFSRNLVLKAIGA